MDDITKLKILANEHHRRITDALVMLVDLYDRDDLTCRMNELRNWKYRLGPELEVPFPDVECDNPQQH